MHPIPGGGGGYRIPSHRGDWPMCSEGAEWFRYTRGFSAYPEVFLLFGTHVPRHLILFQVPPGGVVSIAAEADFHQRPSAWGFRALFRGGSFPGPSVLRSYLAERVFREGKLPSLLGREGNPGFEGVP